MAARLRQLQRAGIVDGIRLPDGSLAPPCHQHAGRSEGVKGLDEVGVLLAAAQSESPKPPWLTAYTALQHRRLDRLTRQLWVAADTRGCSLRGCDSALVSGSHD